MSKFRVSVSETTNGWMEVEAPTAYEAICIVQDMAWSDIREDAEWGSCGDEVEVWDYVEEVYEPSVSEVLWK
jgi:hypothetical protein